MLYSFEDVFDNLTNQKVYIFGAGKRGIYLKFLLEERGICVRAFIDSGRDRQGTKICDKECMDLNTVIERDNDCCIIISPKKSKDIFEQLKKNGINMDHVYDYTTICKAHHFLPFVKEQEDYKNVYPFNHYESPYPDIREIHEKEDEIFDYQKKVMGVNFNIKRQFELAKLMNEFEIMEWGGESEYRYYNNSWFGKGSAAVLHCMMRILKPKRIIEVGSGFSTAVMLDTNSIYFQNSIEINSIEPNAQRLKSLLKKNDNLKIQECNLQDVPLEFFEQLQENDILFIDSSHVSKVNSDVNYYLFEVFPRLVKGVYIHIHDIFYPFIYPKQWIYEGRAYNEMYLLRAFLMYNNQYSIQFFGNMLMQEYPDKLRDKFRPQGGSLWLRKDY